MPEFVRTSRATVMAIMNARGDTGPPLFVFKGARPPYRQVVVNGRICTETYASHIPKGSVIAMRDGVGGVDSVNFLAWAKRFVEHVRPLTEKNRKVLLMFDAYRAPLSLAVLELFHENGAIVYAIPAHASGKTQPCYLVLFGRYKAELTRALTCTLRVDTVVQFDMYDYCKLMAHAYHEAFSRGDVRNSFERAGLRPVDASRWLTTPQPRSEIDVGTVIAPLELMNMLKRKREAYCDGLFGQSVTMVRSGFVDTLRGCVLTAPTALIATRQKAECNRKK